MFEKVLLIHYTMLCIICKSIVIKGHAASYGSVTRDIYDV